jgi:hypothetical protein
VEVDDVLADEVDLLHLGIGEVLREGVGSLAVEQVLEGGEVADRRVDPDVEVLARAPGISKPK